MIRVLVVDNHELFRLGVVQALAADPDVSVVGEASSADAALDLVDAVRPDVALVDVRLDGIASGTDLVAELARRDPEIGSIVLTEIPDDRIVAIAEDVGAAGCLMKSVSTTDLVASVRRAADGDRSALCAQARLARDRHSHSDDALVDRLTRREQTVFELVGRGQSNRQIARELFLSEKTVKNHVSNLMAKLEMQNRTEMAALAARIDERRAAWAGPRPTEARQRITLRTG